MDKTDKDIAYNIMQDPNSNLHAMEHYNSAKNQDTCEIMG